MSTNHIFANKIHIALISFFLAFFCSTISQAESILIHTKSGAEGQGWLFGAQAGEKCWIVAPLHVVASPETGELEPFYFFDSNGTTGESAMPVAATPQKLDSVAERESSDLVFARVRLGRSDGQCHSRLGLPLYAYQTILSKNDGFSVVSLLKTSYGTFDARLERKSVDKHGGAVIDFAIDNADASKHLRKGISGSTITTKSSGQPQPVAMVLKILEDQTTLRALRYDYIKDRFDKMRLLDDSAHQQVAGNGDIDFNIIQAKYLPLSGDLGAYSLTSHSGCWKAAALGGQRIVELVIAVKESSVKVQTLEVVQSAKCNGNSVKFWVDQRVTPTDAWSYVGAGTSQYGVDNPCRIALSGPREFRLRFEAVQTVILSGLRLR